MPDCSPARVLIRPTDADVEQVVAAGSGPQSVHLLGGVAGYAPHRRVLPRLVKTGAIIGLISESADSRGILGLARRAKYHWDRYVFGRKFDFILAMGQLGVQWFKSAGYDSSRIFPFVYSTERPVITSENGGERNEGGAFRILYLGQLIGRKDCITAIGALDKISVFDWRFDVVGNGPELEHWKRVSAESRVSERVCFSPGVDNRVVGRLLDHADMLLLPSRWDGWGAVVNEALMCGVPVVCSSNCGAADLLREPWRGSVFKAGSVKSLRNVLRGWIEHGKRDAESSARIREWSSAIEGPQMARYLVGIVKCVQQGGERPSPPWYLSN
jgi:glycosyltransferase involved in cell wall biosynthesis